MNTNDMVLVQGMKDTRLALARWQQEPLRAFAPWMALSLLIAATLLFAVYAVAKMSPADPTLLNIPGYYSDPADLGDYLHILIRNGLVLALHSLACVAGFIAGSALPLSAAQRSGFDRWLHEKAGPLAIGFVTAATFFSLMTQAYVIGGNAATIARQVGLSEGVLVLSLLPHALPELFALFLPLAAWIIASRRNEWHDLLAATFVTTAIAIPLLLASAAVELWVSPELLRDPGPLTATTPPRRGRRPSDKTRRSATSSSSASAWCTSA